MNKQLMHDKVLKKLYPLSKPASFDRTTCSSSGQTIINSSYKLMGEGIEDAATESTSSDSSDTDIPENSDYDISEEEPASFFDIIIQEMGVLDTYPKDIKPASSATESCHEIICDDVKQHVSNDRPLTDDILVDHSANVSSTSNPRIYTVSDKAGDYINEHLAVKRTRTECPEIESVHNKQNKLPTKNQKRKQKKKRHKERVKAQNMFSTPTIESSEVSSSVIPDKNKDKR